MNAPVLVEKGEHVAVLPSGWHDHAGGIFVLRGKAPAVVPIKEAAAALLDLLAEFDFVTPGDKSRAIASLVTPALKLGGWITGHHPADVAEADQSQSGKTYRQKLQMALYNEQPYFVARRIGGVGSLDESYSQALLSGRPFVMIDNVRGRLDSQLLEMALTAGGHIPCRTPGRAEIMVDVRHVFHLLTSNGVETTADFANRSSIIRIRRRARHTFRQFTEGDLLNHVRARQAYYLGCVFTVIEQWKAHGKQSTRDTRHDFREWAGVLDWIVQNVLGLAPLLDGHEAAQRRVSNPAMTWLRLVALAVEAAGRIGDELNASMIAELCGEHDVEVFGAKPGADEIGQRKAIGSTMARVFKDRPEVEIDRFLVTRTERNEAREGGGTYLAKYYRFTRHE